jgi:hypothetical protein
VSLSLVPFPDHQRHTFTDCGVVYEAEYKELRLVVPDDASIVADKHRMSWVSTNVPVLSWASKTGPVKSNAKEVLELAHTRGSGFRMAK